MKKATETYVKLMHEMSAWYWQWKNASPTADPEYIDFVRGEYEFAKMKLKEEEARLIESC